MSGATIVTPVPALYANRSDVPPVYVAPRPVYFEPQPIYYAPPPVYVAPPRYVSYPVYPRYFGERREWRFRHHHEHHRYD